MIPKPHRAAFLLLIAALSAGCVSFEVVPVAKTGCDAVLAGTWRAEEARGEDLTSDNKRLTVSEDCAISGLEDGETAETHRFRTFELAGQRYIAVEAEKELTVADNEGKTIETWPKARVELYRYRIQDDRLLLWSADAGLAQTLGGDGITVHSDATLDAKTGKPLPSMVQNSIYLGGKRRALAALLRKHGDALYQGMTPERAIVMRRAAAKAAP